MRNEMRWLLEEKYHRKPTVKFKKDALRLEAGEPLDYVIGFVEFLGCRIDLSKKPLIPRVETEYWAELAIGELRQRKGKLNALEMFAGSGAIGIAALRHIPGLLCDFADTEKNCLLQIAMNCKKNRLDKKRWRVIRSDIFSNITREYDVIFANPPYIPVTRKHALQRSVLDYEPEKALFGGEDGLQYIAAFLSDARRFLHPDGVVYMEFDSPQKPAIARLVKKIGYRSAEFRKDQFGRWRWVAVRF